MPAPSLRFDWCCTKAPLNSVEIHPFSSVRSMELGPTSAAKDSLAAAIHTRAGFGFLHLL